MKYIEESVCSVLNQTHKNLELIIIDNCSSDGTKEVVEKLEKKDRRINAVYHQKNVGIGASINEGLVLATGEMVAFTSSDDIWDHKKLEEQVAILEEKDGVDMVHSDADIIDSTGKRTGRAISKTYNVRGEIASGDVFEILCRGNICCTSTILFRKKCLSTYNKFDERLKYAHDWWFLINLSKKHKFYYMPECLVKYRVHGTNLTRNIELVYTDYWLIHSWLADMNIEPKNHLISAAFAAAIIDKPKESKEALEKAQRYGKFNVQEKMMVTLIQKFKNKQVLLHLNSIRRGATGLFYDVRRSIDASWNYLRR